MGLLHHDVTFLNFDESYAWQRRLARHADEWIDLSDVAEANLFCAESARAEIARRLAGRNGQGITWIGSGNYHYVTLLLLSEIDKPFSLVLFDNHTDTKFPGGMPGLLSCGSWVTDAIMRLPHLKQVLIVGAHAEPNVAPADPQGKIVLWPDAADPAQLLAAIPTDSIYISIDKDVLDRAFAVTNWDQGNMRLGTLLETVQALIRKKNVLGIDICGELPVSPTDIWSHAEALRLNEQANLAILQSVMCA